MFDCIQQKCAARAKEGRSFTSEDGTVFQFDGCGGNAGLFKAIVGCNGGFSIGRSEFGLFHHQGVLVNLLLCGFTIGKIAQGSVIAADDFLVRGLATYLVVADAGANHIDAHVSGGLVG